ncbi:response regulator [Rhodococcus sp. P1Y]|uniref:response regulator n=1 Tax=Rhodococcus sp. P1Y TaxID=1302308 RepID=UPI000EAD1CB3|nr:response regulator [Rhodococcus sp. P1Y]AYJ48387.1 DNA-binding response regulator [Rhodococcus sp. P1Y]
MSSARSCLIVDDSDAFCVAARRVLEAGGITVVGTASTLAGAVETADLVHPDLVLVDIDLGDESGFDVVEALHAASAPVPAIILVSTHDADDFADLVESSSAIGFLPKFELSAASVDALLASLT